MEKMIRVLCLITLLGCWLTAVAFEEGKHYQRLSEESVLKNTFAKALLKEAKTRNEVQVLEFFSYACNWCYKLDPAIEKWKQNVPKYVDFQHVPVEFHPAWSLFSKAYYAQKQLDILGKTHAALFEAVQTDAIQPSEEGIVNFFVAQGIAKEKIMQALNSTETHRQQGWAAAIAQAYRITSVPTFIVQGKKGIFLSSVSLAGSEEDLLKVMDELIKKARD